MQAWTCLPFHAFHDIHCHRRPWAKCSNFVKVSKFFFSRQKQTFTVYRRKKITLEHLSFNCFKSLKKRGKKRKTKTQWLKLFSCIRRHFSFLFIIFNCANSFPSILLLQMSWLGIGINGIDIQLISWNVSPTIILIRKLFWNNPSNVKWTNSNEFWLIQNLC